jgi:hypothetical protein
VTGCRESQYIVKLPELLKRIAEHFAVARPWRTIARKATPTACYWLVLSLLTFLGMSAAVKIEATATRLFLVVVVVGVAFSAACFLERLLRDYMQTDIQPSSETSDLTGGFVHVTDTFADQFTAAVAPSSSSATTAGGVFGAAMEGDFGYFGAGQLFPEFDDGILAAEKNRWYATFRRRVGYVTGPSLIYLTGSLPKWLDRGQPVRRAEPQTPQTQVGLWCWLPS